METETITLEYEDKTVGIRIEGELTPTRQAVLEAYYLVLAEIAEKLRPASHLAAHESFRGWTIEQCVLRPPEGSRCSRSEHIRFTGTFSQALAFILADGRCGEKATTAPASPAPAASGA